MPSTGGTSHIITSKMDDGNTINEDSDEVVRASTTFYTQHRYTQIFFGQC